MELMICMSQVIRFFAFNPEISHPLPSSMTLWQGSLLVWKCSNVRPFTVSDPRLLLF